MTVKHTKINPLIKMLIEQNPYVGSTTWMKDYMFYSFFHKGQLKGFIGYFKKKGIKWEGEYAFLSILSLERGWGTKMLQHVISIIPVDLLIWVSHSKNKRSIGLAKKFGFSEEGFIRFDEVEQNPRIEKSGFVGALSIRSLDGR